MSAIYHAAMPDAAPHRSATAKNTSGSLTDRLSQVAGSEVALALAITVLAAVLRLWRLGTIPLGLHGDEAWTGLDAERVLDEGWIGPYLVSALGQPIGPVYWAAAVFAVLPDTTLVLRASMAFFGIATIPLSYVTFRLMFDRTVAVFAALLLAFMMWHLHLSRTAFMVQTAPFMELSRCPAVRRRRRRRVTADLRPDEVPALSSA